MGTIAFLMIGYVGGIEHYGRFIAILFLFTTECALFCLAIACMLTDFGTATLVASIAMLFKMLMAGFLINSGIQSNLSRTNPSCVTMDPISLILQVCI